MIVLLCLLMTATVWAGELPPPTPRKDRPVADELYLRRIHQEWNNDEITTTNPDGAIRAQRGDRLIYDTGGGLKPCVNNSTTNVGTVWVCAPSVYTSP